MKIDTTPPVFIKSTPTSNKQSVELNSSITLTFNEKIKAGTGNIVITDGTDTRLISITDTQIKISNNSIIIQPNVNFFPNSNYTVKIGAKAIQDLAGNAYKEIKTPLSFVTKNSVIPATVAPVFVSAIVKGNVLVMTLKDNNSLNTDTVLPSIFSVINDNIVNPVTDVFVNSTAKTVALILTNQTISGQIVTVAYTTPVGNNQNYALQDVIGNDVASFSAQSVINKNTVIVVTPPKIPSPILTLSSDVTTVDEGKSVTFTITSDSVAPAGGFTIAYTLTGTATNGKDYTVASAATKSVLIPAGSKVGTLTLHTIADNLTEGVETITLASGSSNSISVNINDTSLTPTVAPTSKNYEDKAPFIYQFNNVQQLDSITTLLTYSPSVSNNVDYSTYEVQKWRTRASSQDLAIDLTQTNTLTNKVELQGNLESNATSQIWYKIHLTQTSTLQVQDISSDFNIINPAIFKSNSSGGLVGLTFSSSLYDSTHQLNSYAQVDAGDYFVRIDKSDTNSTHQQINEVSPFDVLINTQPSSEFIIPTLNINANQSSIHAELSPSDTYVYYKFSVNQNSKFTLDTTQLASQFNINIVKPTVNGYSGVSASYYTNAPQSYIYSLTAGTYYLQVKSLNLLTTITKLDIPVISTTAINTLFNDTSLNVLQVDVNHPKPAITQDVTGNLELTYSFDLGTLSATPNYTAFSDAEKQATRLALQEYAHIAKLTFREIPNGSNENSDIKLVNTSDLGSAAGDTLTSNSSDLSNVVIRINSSKITDNSIKVGSLDYLTLLHEIGHALGLKHPQVYGPDGASSVVPFLVSTKDNQQYTIMSYNPHPYKSDSGYLFYQNNGATHEKTPLLYDIAAIQSLYDVNSNYNNTDTLYKWDKNVDPYMTIWDGGGVDTIDVSNQTQKQVIDLRSGHFSSLGAVTTMYTDGSSVLNVAQDNVSIAYGVVIENAIGSPQDDTLIGNSVSNILTGNGGKDNFVFASPLGSFNVDTITDFNENDTITLDRSIFKTLNSSSLLNTSEWLMTTTTTYAENATQRIIFNSLTHYLYYDAEDSNNSIAFAILPNVTSLNVGQIFIQG